MFHTIQEVLFNIKPILIFLDVVANGNNMISIGSSEFNSLSYAHITTIVMHLTI